MKTIYLHTEQTCRVTFVKEMRVEEDAPQHVIDEMIEQGVGELLGVSIGDTVADLSERIEADPQLPDLFYREPDPQVRSILDISTAHVSESTGAMLNTWAELACPPGAAIVHNKGEYGWLVYVPSEMSSREDKHLIPDDLWDVMVYAHAKGCDWIMFDRDGVTIPALKEFEW